MDDDGYDSWRWMMMNQYGSWCIMIMLSDGEDGGWWWMIMENSDEDDHHHHDDW